MTMEGDHRETHYNVELTLDPEQGSLHANVELLCSSIEQQCSNLEFYLHKSMEIKSITGSVPITYQFDVEQPCSFPFTPDAGTLKIKLTQPVEDDKLLRIWFEYEGNIGVPPWEVNRITPGWVELGFYAPWFPYRPELKQFCYDVQVQIDPGYEVIGLGEVKQLGEGLWHISQKQPSADMVVMASNRFCRLRGAESGLEVELDYVDVAKWVVEDVFKKGLQALKWFSEWFGVTSSVDMRIVITPRIEGGGYARTGFVVLPRIDTESYKEEEVSYFSNLAHECAHLWWANAPVNSWEDWLNESFAEYSALMAVRELFGTERFESILAKKLKRSEGMPPIKGIKRNDERAFTVLYDKGCLVLYELEQMAGRKEFIEVLRKTFQQKVSSTAEFVELVGADVSNEAKKKLNRLLSS